MPLAFNLPVFPEIRTKRLVLRGLRPEDASDVLRFRGDPEVQKFNDETLKSEEEARAFIEDLEQRQGDRQGFWWGLTGPEGDGVVGMVSLWHLDEWHRRGELGFDLLNAEPWGPIPENGGAG
jgi:ribosomal-protein-alanine N-acetyltransferase